MATDGRTDGDVVGKEDQPTHTFTFTVIVGKRRNMMGWYRIGQQDRVGSARWNKNK